MLGTLLHGTATYIGDKWPASKPQRAWLDLAEDPAKHSELMHIQATDGAKAAEFLVVRIDGGKLNEDLANKKLQLCVKLGGPSKSVTRITHQVQVASEGSVHFGSTCVFPWRTEYCRPLVRLFLSEVDGSAATLLAREEFEMPAGYEELVLSRQKNILLFDHPDRKQRLGALRVDVGLMTVPFAEFHEQGESIFPTPLATPPPVTSEPGASNAVAVAEP